MRYAIKLDDDVRDVLHRSTITDHSVTLPPKLDRALYLKVDKVLRAAGGTWDRKKQAHVFHLNPVAVLGLAIEDGEILDERKARQAFYTPPELAQYVVEQALLAPGQRVLEPSAGHGALIRAAQSKIGPEGHVLAVENDPKALEVLDRTEGILFDLEVISGDFLQVEATPARMVDRVIMNPPFTGSQEVAHVQHALKFLKLSGVLVSIMSPGITFRKDKAYEQLRRILSAVDPAWTFTPLPAGSFKESGTAVNTGLLRVFRQF